MNLKVLVRTVASSGLAALLLVSALMAARGG